jgi:ATP-binding protein involved in chromosome partitioning
MSDNQLKTEDVLSALSKVQEPELRKDLVTLNMVRDIQIEEGNVSFRLVLTTPACPLKAKIESEARQAVSALPGVKRIEINMDAQVPQDGRSRGLMNLPIHNAIAVGSGAQVGLLDADIYGPNIPTMMGVKQLPTQQGEKLIPAVAYGVKFMSIGFLVKPGQPLIWRGPMLHSAIRQFLSDVEWGQLDYLIVDLPPGTGDAALSLAQSLPLSGGVIVTLPQQVSLEDARRGLEMFRQLDVEVFGIVENMSYLELPDGTRLDIFGSGGGEKMARETGVPFIAAIPMDPTVRVGGDKGIPVVISDPESAVSAALTDMAKNIAAKISVAAVSQKDNIPIKMI